MTEEHLPQGDWRPRPDPTALTTEQLLREVSALEALMEERIARVQKSVDCLKELHGGILSERHARYSERFEASEDAVKLALREARDSATKAVTSQKEAVDAAFEASEKAIAKAEVAIQSKADVTFVKLEKVQDMMSDLIRRSDAEQRFADHLERIQTLSTRVTQIESMKTGASDLTKTIIAVGTFILFVITFFAARGGL